MKENHLPYLLPDGSSPLITASYPTYCFHESNQDFERIYPYFEQLPVSDSFDCFNNDIASNAKELIKMIEKDSFSIVKCLEIQQKIEKILLDKKLYFKI